MTPKDSLIFFVNGVRVEEAHPDPSQSLADYIRTNLGLKGTKIGCRQGFCGACTVMLSEVGQNDKLRHYSVNACLYPVCAAHGKAVTTVEGLNGDKKLHPIQERIVKAHGTQCGFCTPGFVMTMYALLRINPHPSMQEIDEHVQGNLCRCTGYRPILEAFQTFAKEECCGMGDACCKKKNKEEKDGKLVNWDDIRPYDPSQEPIFPPELKVSKVGCTETVFCGKGVEWYRPTSLTNFLELKKTHPNARIISGNTNLETKGKFVKEIAEHLQWYGSTQIRNVATIGGSIGAAASASDLNLTWTALKAKCRVAVDGTVKEVDITPSFLSEAGKHSVLGVQIPFSNPLQHFHMFKQAKKREFDVAIANGAILLHLDANNNIELFRYAFGGAHRSQIAVFESAENEIKGLEWSGATFEQLSGWVGAELEKAGTREGDKYPSILCHSFLLKFFNKVHKTFAGVDQKSTCAYLSSHQTFGKNVHESFPLVGKPIAHMAAEQQVSGTALFTDDINAVELKLYLCDQPNPTSAGAKSYRACLG